MDKTLGNGLTQEIIRKIDRENRNIRLRRVGKRIQRITKRAMTEAVRFTALLVGESLFAFAIVPAMERQPERVLLIAEILAVLPDMPVTEQLGDVGKFIREHKEEDYFGGSKR